MRPLAKIIRSRKGSTLPELMIASVILGLGLAAAAAGLKSFGDVKFKTVGASAKNDITASLIDNIRSNIAQYQMNFHSSNDTDPVLGSLVTDVVLDPEQLPFAWSNNFVGGADDCPDCPGRYGYIIQPLDSYKHLYKVTVRIINTDLFEGHKDYIFITGNK